LRAAESTVPIRRTCPEPLLDGRSAKAWALVVTDYPKAGDLRLLGTRRVEYSRRTP
jgi:hypothetical protein